jgi:geranylgeranyl pyrophosphate synthase
MPTVNALFSHQVAVLMGDFLYARALTELVRLNDWDVARIFADASTQMTVGEMRQLSALDALAFSEADYDQLIQAKTASLFRARASWVRCAARASTATRSPATASGSAWPSRSSTTSSTTPRTPRSPGSRRGSICASTRSRSR